MNNIKTGLTTKHITIIVIAVAVIALGSGLLLYNSVQRFTFKEAAVLPVDAELMQISPGDTAKLKNGEDYATITVSTGETFSGEENAAFYIDRDGLVTMSDWEFVTAPMNGQVETYRVGCFTEFEKSGQNLILKRNGKTAIASGSLLFNGKDTYVFFEDAVMTVEDERIELPAFSYVTACFGNWVQYYNRKTGEYGMIEIDDFKRVTVEIGEYGIQITADADQMSCMGNDYMLLSTLSFLDEYELE